MAESLGPTFYDEMAPHGPRRLLAIGLIFLTGLLPTLPVWNPGLAASANASAKVPVASGVSPSLQAALGRPGLSRTLSSGLLLMAAVGGALGMLLYQPRRGYKLCALIAGPLIGLGAVWATHTYLLVRPDVLRFEPVVAALLGGLPGVILYAVLTRISYAQQQNPALAAAA